MGTRACRILTIDGGGIRGIIPAIWLCELQKKLSRPLAKYFHLMAGTSTGSILACGIAKGIDLETIVGMYTERGREIFPSPKSRLWSRATSYGSPKYKGIGLTKVLKDVFRTSQFGTFKKPIVMVTAYDTLGREGFVFKSHNEKYKELKVWDLCRASCSAPTYFPAHVIKINGVEIPFIDGGVVANNPTACALAEAVRLNNPKVTNDPCDLNDMLVLSLGTGELIRPISIEEAQKWGRLQWAVPIVDVLFDGNSDATHYIARQLLQPEHYFRMQVKLTSAYDEMDNADATNLNALKRLAYNYLESQDGHKRFNEIIDKLEQEADESNL